MPPRPRWWHILQESRRQACVAVDFYNRSGDKRSYYDFVMHMHTAWLYLMHAQYERGGVDYLYRNSRGHAEKTADGDKKTWDLQRCVRERFTENDPVRANVEFFIGLRNKIEHRFQDALLLATAGAAHAYVINYEQELVARFGPEHSLGDELRFPVFVQSLTPAGVEEQRKLRKRLPASARTFITRFEDQLDAAVRSSERFDYRVMLTPLRGPKTDADMAITIVKADELTEQKRLEMEQSGQLGTMLITEKQRDVMHKDEMLPAEAVQAIAALIPFEFNLHYFQLLWKFHGVRPGSKDPNPENTDTRYCLWNKPVKRHVYTPAYVRKCASEIETREGWLKAFGKEPVLKVTKIGKGVGAPKQGSAASAS